MSRTAELLTRLDLEVEKFHLQRASDFIAARLALNTHKEIRMAGEFSTLPKLVGGLRHDMDVKATGLAQRLAKLRDRANVAIDRHHALAGADEGAVAEMEKTAAELESLIGGNGAPHDDPPLAVSGESSTNSPETRASAFSDLHPSARKQVF